MGIHGYCPMCDRQIPPERFAVGFAVCSCGWHDRSIARENDLKTEKSNLGWMMASFLSVFLLLTHVISWGSYAFEIPFLKAQKLAGVLSDQGYDEIAQICVKLGKLDCALDAYSSQFSKTKNKEALARLANLHMRVGQTDLAAVSFEKYMEVGGEDGEALANYGRILEGKKQFKDALKVYQMSIANRPDTLPVNATSGIVRILMRQGRYDEARKRILTFHDSAGNAKGYLNTELQALDAQLGRRKANRAIASVPGRG